MSFPKHIHIVGICGVATSAIAIAFKDAGARVTGSDKGFFSPVSDELEANGIEFYAGWHPEKMGHPDFVMTGGSGTSPSNPEVVYARENDIPVYAYPEVLHKYFIRKNSIVTVGTWGKTTTSALLSYILLESGLNPSYFTGGLSLSHKTGMISDSEWSVVEGDEYQVSISDKRPKFVYYSPTHLLLTSLSWDHADLYPTERSYMKVFEDLVGKIPLVGKIVANGDLSEVVSLVNKFPHVTYYGKSGERLDYRYKDVIQTKDGLDFTIVHKNDEYRIHSNLLGLFQAENITACFAMAHQIGITPEKIVEGIKSFKGLKRRLEKRFDEGVTVIDDIAHSPEKATPVLETLKSIYDGKIITIFEPNIGGRQRESIKKYDHAFKISDTVIIPRLSKLKVAPDAKEIPMEGKELCEVISKTHPKVDYIEDDIELVEFIAEKVNKGDVVVFLGSHGFRGMIEDTIISLRQLSL